MKRIFLFVLATVALGAWNLDTTQPDAPNIPSNPATETFDPRLKIDLSKFTKTTNGVYYLDPKVGTGATISGSPAITFSYIGFLKTFDVFDENQVTSPVLLSGLIVGFQEGLQGMKVGGERILVIPSALGYQNQSRPGIPPNSTLVFDVILNGIS
jgi:FKBP-type peptidyl-prolyl cis-trans isomerase